MARLPLRAWRAAGYQVSPGVIDHAQRNRSHAEHIAEMGHSGMWDGRQYVGFGDGLGRSGLATVPLPESWSVLFRPDGSRLLPAPMSMDCQSPFVNAYRHRRSSGEVEALRLCTRTLGTRRLSYPAVMQTLTTWRQMGGSKLTILGGEPTLHPDYVRIIRDAKALGYEHIITTSNGLGRAARKFAFMEPQDFSYVQISLDGGSQDSHDQVRGAGTFAQALDTITRLCARGFDTRIICTVNRANQQDCLNLLDIADEFGVSLVKFHVFSVIGSGHGAAQWGITPGEWIDFYEHLESVAPGHRTRVWYQPTYARRERMAGYAADGYRGCIGRTLDRISIFPDGRGYVCSFLFDTDLHFATMLNGQVVLNKNTNEFDLFTKVLTQASCGDCKVSGTCMGGCPAEELVMGAASCVTDPDIVPVCRLWKADIPAGLS